MGVTSTRPMLIAALLLVLAVAAAVAFAPARVLNLLARGVGDHTLSADLRYGPLERQRMDLYTPTGTAPPGGWPMVVFFYGGSWNTGARGDYRFVAASLASRGVLTLVADYRLYPEVRYPEFLNDSAQALAFGLREAARLGANPKRVFVMGHSAGAYNAAMLALDARWLGTTGHAPRELAGWIGLAGPYDFFPTDNVDAQPVFFHPNYPAAAQPIEHATGTSLPAFLAAPVDDVLVSPTRSTRGLAQRLRAAGTAVTMQLYPRASHASLIGAMAWPLRWIAPVHVDVLAFIESTPPRP